MRRGDGPVERREVMHSAVSTRSHRSQRARRQSPPRGGGHYYRVASGSDVIPTLPRGRATQTGEILFFYGDV